MKTSKIIEKLYLNSIRVLCLKLYKVGDFKLYNVGGLRSFKIGIVMLTNTKKEQNLLGDKNKLSDKQSLRM